MALPARIASCQPAPLTPREPAAAVVMMGYGNPLCGDDGFGPAVVQPLAQRILDASVRVHVTRQLTPELATELAEARLVIFVDAAVHLAPGELRFTRLRPAQPHATPLTHHLAAASLLELCRRLYGRTPRAVVCAAGASALELGQGMAPRVRKAAHRARMRLAALIARRSRRTVHRRFRHA